MCNNILYSAIHHTYVVQKFEIQQRKWFSQHEERRFIDFYHSSF